MRVLTVCAIVVILFVLLAVPAYAFPPGDVNHDNQVNLNDFYIMRPVYLAIRGDVRYDARADLNNDGQINCRDYSTWFANFEKW